MSTASGVPIANLKLVNVMQSCYHITAGCSNCQCCGAYGHVLFEAIAWINQCLAKLESNWSQTRTNRSCSIINRKTASTRNCPMVRCSRQAASSYWFRVGSGWPGRVRRLHPTQSRGTHTPWPPRMPRSQAYVAQLPASEASSSQ